MGDVGVRDKGEIVANVIEGAFEVLDGFELVREQRDTLSGITLETAEAEIFARSALALKYEPDPTKLAPITETQILQARRLQDSKPDLWSTFNRVQRTLYAVACPRGPPAAAAWRHGPRRASINR